MRRAGLGIGVVAAALFAAGCGGSKTVTVTTTRTVTTARTVTAGRATQPSPTSGACTGSDLSGSFAVVPGSAGAGQISYQLTLTNTSQGSCFLSGLPDALLLDETGAALPTHVSPARSGQPAAARITLEPGASVHAQARFSPDIPGPGERQTGPCEPVATRLRVQATGGGTVDVPVRPPTSVCEHGSLVFEVLAGAR